MKTLPLFSILLAAFAASAVAAPLAETPVPANPERISATLVAGDALPNSGRVEESIPAGNYTYLRVVKDGKETWLAITRRDIPVGTEIGYRNGNEMRNFHSPSLNRDFEQILFLGGVTVMGDTAAAKPADHPAAGTPAALPPGHPKASTDPMTNSGRVEEAIAAGNYTYLRVADNGKENWLAIPRRDDIPVGSEVRYGEGSVMENFHSPSLGRSFEAVVFLSGVELAGK